MQAVTHSRPGILHASCSMLFVQFRFPCTGGERRPGMFSAGILRCRKAIDQDPTERKILHVLSCIQGFGARAMACALSRVIVRKLQHAHYPGILHTSCRKLLSNLILHWTMSGYGDLSPKLASGDLLRFSQVYGVCAAGCSLSSIATLELQ